jgi:hypothetical protein
MELLLKLFPEIVSRLSAEAVTDLWMSRPAAFEPSSRRVSAMARLARPWRTITIGRCEAHGTQFGRVAG